MRHFYSLSDPTDFTYDLPGLSFEDKGIFEYGRSYSKGNGVTYNGCFWIAQDETSEKPGTGNGWCLAARKGRDAR